MVFLRISKLLLVQLAKYGSSKLIICDKSKDLSFIWRLQTLINAVLVISSHFVQGKNSRTNMIVIVKVFD